LLLSSFPPPAVTLTIPPVSTPRYCPNCTKEHEVDDTMMGSELRGSQKVNKINLRPSENTGERGRGVSSSVGPVV